MKSITAAHSSGKPAFPSDTQSVRRRRHPSAAPRLQQLLEQRPRTLDELAAAGIDGPALTGAVQSLIRRGHIFFLGAYALLKGGDE